ncbi:MULTISPECIES: lysophospholipid acyltransferase family protein [unclassified Myroides]|uniref:lysophospholipid acyltransferase family protein n=1 Tax=unclassified Myroides TaxID=2642485 RepID=UPI0015FC5F26|nr:MULTISPECIES: lysophospholipid acyltransferase family protein [unclassified Myroides]MBB1149174.1 1-acyl-sn-glycerol-3-phosphate acyltransferase [Myroides sp. NP-2]MDM1406065.1 1-acyl-sn-glycerol-3-phosphate acyltransferase [Myroides sp. DF42-4-2]
MKYIRIFFSVLWRAWFYLWMLVVILLLSPLLLATIWSDSTYPTFFKVARLWAKLTFFGMGMSYHIESAYALEKGKSYMFVANHTSMMDIMMMLILVPDNPFVFVGKKELAKLPIFGFFYKRTCILVDRKDSKSRYQVFESAQAKLNQGLSICIFPEGGVPDDRTIVLDHFKDGAFRLAIDHQIPIVPLAMGYLKYFFPFQWGLGKPGTVPVVIQPPISTAGCTQENKKVLKEATHHSILEQLLTWEEKRARKDIKSIVNP